MSKKINRQTTIAEMLINKDNISVDYLSNHFGVSKVTIRKDLTDLQSKGILLRGHGEAHSLADITKKSINLMSRLEENYQEKLKIVQYASKLVKSREVVLIGPGSTCLLLAEELSKREDVIIVTNAVNFQPVLETPRATVIYLGGEYNNLNGSTIGHITSENLKAFSIDKFFFSANGISDDNEITSFDFSGYELVELMIKQSRESILIADSIKIGKPTGIKIATAQQIDIFITNNIVDKKQKNKLIKHYKKVIFV